MKNDAQSKMTKLEIWAASQNISIDKLSNVFEMLRLEKRGERGINDPMQFPSCYIRDEFASAWHDPANYSWVPLLEENFLDIQKEALAIFKQNVMDVHPDNEGLAGDGTWNTFFFYKNGINYPENHAKCPLTSSILAKIPGVEIAGRTYFSAMTPGIHIKPHCGPHNFKLRTHLGLITPIEAVIRVEETIKPWPEGKCIVFDDSFEHEVWNNSDVTRIVLIVDVWNPILTSEEIRAIEYIMPEFYLRT